MSTPQALLSHAQHETGERSSPADGLTGIRLLELPDVGPPFDDEASPAGAAAAGGEANPASDPSHATEPGARPFAVSVTDREWAQKFAALLTEALSGARPVRQILPWTSRRARVQLPALMPLFGGGQRPRVLRVIATRPARDVIEMTVVAGVGARTRALAVRLQRADLAEHKARPGQLGTRPGKATATTARWLCTDIEAA